MKLLPMTVFVMSLSVFAACAEVSWAEAEQQVAPADAPSKQEELGKQDKQAKRIEQLEKELVVLSGIVEGTAKPINLGRTSLAAVNASSVNGTRALDNKFYGVVNAFDGGNNWHNNLNYTYWLTSGGLGQWAEVYFDKPVTVTSIHLNFGGRVQAGYSVKLTFAKGGEKNVNVTGIDLNLSEPAHGVKSVRLSLTQSVSNTQVHEIQVMGHVGPKVKYKVQRPRILMNKYNASAIATAQYDQWREAVVPRSNSKIQETDKQFIITYRIGGQNVLQVFISKIDGSVTRKPLVKLVPIDPDDS
jgi:hypothetical protein